MSLTIPKIIHQIWIGDKPMPTKFMDTWKNKHPEFEYIRWTEEEIKKRELILKCSKQINIMSEINGKADIIRWEILYKYGGFFVDADSICIEPFDDTILSQKAFAGYENEEVRKGLVATGTMGFYPNHLLCKDAIEWILKNDVSIERTGNRAWKTVGPGLLTSLINNNKYKDFTIFPSMFFLPHHYSGFRYNGHKKVYAYQEWGSTKQNYEEMNNIKLPIDLVEPKSQVSILISSYNTKHIYVVDCLSSIKNQLGHFGMEIIWINDGSSSINSLLLEKELENFKNTTRFTKVIYKKMDINKGIPTCLNIGLKLCSNEIIIKMDSDDIMAPFRIQTQLEFMKTNLNCVMCGSNITFFKTNDNERNKIITGNTTHPLVLTWNEYKKNPSHWFMNHPTLCYKKSEILSLGGYDETIEVGEDFNLEVKVLKKYGVIYNIEKSLLLYRIHENQTTYKGKGSSPELIEFRKQFINKICNE